MAKAVPLLAVLLTGIATPAWSAARITESGRYICADGSSVHLDRRGYGPTLIRNGRESHLKNRWVLTGFRFTGDGVIVRGRGTGAAKTVTLTETGHPAVECAATPAGATPGIVTGIVTAQAPITIPPGARLIVQLRDTARMDASAPLLGQAEITPDRHQLPLAFLLRHSPASVTPRSRAALSARLISATGKLLAVSDTFIPLPQPDRGRNRDAIISLRPVSPTPPAPRR